MQQWEIHLCEDTDFAMAVILDDTHGNSRNRWIKTYSSIDALSWDMERLGLITWSSAQVMRENGLAFPLMSFPTYVANPKETLRTFELHPLTQLQ
jgi:hypothetical protein